MTITSKQLVHIVAAAAEDKKAHDVLTLSIEKVSLVSDYFIVCHGNSDVQVQAIATEIRKKAEQAGARLRGLEGMDTCRWVLIDLGDVVAHVFHKEEREYYNIERLWSDAKVVERV